MGFRSGILGAALAATLGSVSASAAVVTLTFEGLGNLAPVGGFYNGGAGGNLGVTFSDNALAFIDSDAGGSGNFGGEPSPDTALSSMEGHFINVNVAGGFTTGLSLFYSAWLRSGTVHVYEGLDGAGGELGWLYLPTTRFRAAPDPFGDFSPFFPVGLEFSGIAKSVRLSGTANQIGFDNISFGTSLPIGEIIHPSPIPVPGTLPLLVTALGAFGLIRRRPRR